MIFPPLRSGGGAERSEAEGADAALHTSRFLSIVIPRECGGPI